MKYTDDTILTYGQHKFTKLCRVPPDYLLNVLKNRPSDTALCEYVRENIERIIQRRDGLIPTPQIRPTCDKFVYLTKKEANAFLAKIADVEQYHKKPVRSYECEFCGFWHTTSRPA